MYLGKRFKMEKKICVLCKNEFEGFGCNPEPLAQGVCCEVCDSTKVIPERIRIYQLEHEAEIKRLKYIEEHEK